MPRSRLTTSAGSISTGIPPATVKPLKAIPSGRFAMNPVRCEACRLAGNIALDL
jgi:hypothetical protein